MGAGNGTLSLFSQSGAEMATLSAQSAAGGGVLRLAQSTGHSGVWMDGDQGEFRVYNSAGTPAFELDGGKFGRGSFAMNRPDGTSSLYFVSQETDQESGALYLFNDDREVSIELDPGFGGMGRVITDELQITGGADLSEGFRLGRDSKEVVPGTVLVIAEGATGELVTSTRAYDSRVAGVVSGAGDVRPGLLMGQRNTIADGEVPVALTGRVYVRVDASESPVLAGDLLTTSATPGHAMKAVEVSRRPGAILGKALTGLQSGQGLVLTLVTLQ